jgi:actin-related protein
MADDGLSPTTPRRHRASTSNAREAQGASNVKGAIVVDNGTGIIKAGFAGELEPRSRIPSVVGWERTMPQVRIFCTIASISIKSHFTISHCAFSLFVVVGGSNMAV